MGKIKYLLDSNICIHFMKNDRDVIERIRNAGFENCYLSEITILELLYGVANSDSTKKSDNMKRLQQFEESFKMRILPIRPVFKIFSTEKSRLRKLGTPISDFDLLIGSTAITNNLVMVSRNVKEMDRINGLALENWID